MADERKIVIILKTEEESSGETTDEPKKVESNKEANKSVATAVAAFAAKELLSDAVSEALNWANYEIDKNLNLNDDYISQRNKSIALQMINKTGSAVSTILGSTVYGSMIGGPVGAAVGAALGTVQVVASTARENLQAKEQEEIKLRQMDAQLDYTRQRAGWSTQAASIGEDL